MYKYSVCVCCLGKTEEGARSFRVKSYRNL